MRDVLRRVAVCWKSAEIGILCKLLFPVRVCVVVVLVFFLFTYFLSFFGEKSGESGNLDPNEIHISELLHKFWLHFTTSLPANTLKKGKNDKKPILLRQKHCKTLKNQGEMSKRYVTVFKGEYETKITWKTSFGSSSAYCNKENENEPA